MSVRIDVSRVASQIVTGVGFLGAGVIVLHKRFVVGLTTAAAIWTTAAIGVAVGGGLYAVALAATALTLFGLEFGRVLHRIITKARGGRSHSDEIRDDGAEPDESPMS